MSSAYIPQVLTNLGKVGMYLMLLWCLGVVLMVEKICSQLTRRV